MTAKAMLFNKCRQQRINEGIDDLYVELMQVQIDVAVRKSTDCSDEESWQ
jgi:hypothetical protein